MSRPSPTARRITSEAMRRRARRLLAAGVSLVVAGTAAVTTPAMASSPDASAPTAAVETVVPGAEGTATGSRTGVGAAGQTLTVTPADDIDPSGTEVTVVGTGYNAAAGFDLVNQGLYVAFCVDNGPGVMPSPCVGGIDLEGTGGSARWVTNNPYEGTPAVPILADGSFTTTITIQAADEYVNCLALPAGQECKVVTRMDHRAGGNRSQDVKVPVTFGDGTPSGPTAVVTPTTGLDPEGQAVVVSGTGFPTGEPGVRVVFGPAPTDTSDPGPYGASVIVPPAAIAADGSFTATLTGVTAAYVDGDGVAHDFLDGGGRVSTFRADGAADVDGAWTTSTPVTFLGAAVPASATTLTIAPTTVAAGGAVVMTAEVATVGATVGAAAATSAIDGQAPVTAGTVEFRAGSTSLGTSPLGTTGHATLRHSFAAAGSQVVTAHFSGSATAAASSSAPVTVTVTPAPDPDPDPDPPAGDLTPSGSRTGTGAHGQTLTATPVDNLDPSGTEVDIVGRGFNAAAGFDIATGGLYVSFCVDNGPGAQPTPCVGGVDMEGESGASKWVTNNPYEGVPDEAVTPISADGSFTTSITVAARDEFVDCLALSGDKRCVIVARTDHRATGDRSQDVKVPVCFAGEAACAIEPIDPTGDPSGAFTGFPLTPTPGAGTPGAGLPGGSAGAGAAATPRTLAATGFSGSALVPGGLVAIGLGAALVLWSRRQRIHALALRPAPVRRDR